MITGPPRNLTKLEGDKTELVCVTKALPSNVTYRWLHNGSDVTQLSWLSPRTSIKRDGTLFISPTSSEDMGRFTCEVSNGIGQPDTASAFLSVECMSLSLSFPYSYCHALTLLVFTLRISKNTHRSCTSHVFTNHTVPVVGSGGSRSMLCPG